MRNIPTVTKNLLLVNIIAFVATWLLQIRGIDLNDVCGLHYFMAADFHPWQLVTYMFLHSGFMHILFNMFALWMFGVVIEQTQGPRRFLIYYLVCGLGAGVCQEIVQYIHYLQLDLVQVNYMGQMTDCVLVDGYDRPILLSSYLNAWSCVGASGAVYGVLLAFGLYYPNERMFIIPIPFPIKAKYFVVGYAVIEVLEALTRPGDGVAHVAHLGGMFFGLLLILYWRNRDNHSSRGGGATYVSFDSYNKRF